MRTDAMKYEPTMEYQTLFSATQMKEKMLYTLGNFLRRMERPYLSLMIGTLKSTTKWRSALTLIPAQPMSAFL